MSDEQTYCGGRLDDGAVCKACVFDDDTGAWYFAAARCYVRYCPCCGVGLRVEWGQPVRKAMVPAQPLRQDQTAHTGAALDLPF